MYRARIDFICTFVIEVSINNRATALCMWNRMRHVHIFRPSCQLTGLKQKTDSLGNTYVQVYEFFKCTALSESNHSANMNTSGHSILYKHFANWNGKQTATDCMTVFITTGRSLLRTYIRILFVKRDCLSFQNQTTAMTCTLCIHYVQCLVVSCHLTCNEIRNYLFTNEVINKNCK